MSREALEKVLRVTLGLADVHCAHGWRSSMATLSKDDARFPDRVVEMALDHVVDSAVARAYNRGQHLVERIRLAQWWGEQLHAAEQHVGKVLPIKKPVAKARAA